ncbi:MAG: hypothetical protein Q9162_001220 [Coniocarpon cinnabarinum]
MPAAPNNPPTLPLSGSLLSTLQPATYLHYHLTQSNTRPTSVRTPTTFRKLSCTTSSLTHCAGSALIRAGDTTVVCGIQSEILLQSAVFDPPRPRLVPPKTKREEDVREQEDLLSLGLLVPNVELNTGCHPSFLPGEGRAPGQLQQSLSVRLLRLLISTGVVRLEDLMIRRGREHGHPDEESEGEEELVGYWVLYITFIPISLDGTSSLFDILWAAVLAALQDVKLPKAWWDTEKEAIVCSDLPSEARSLNLRGSPVSSTFGAFKPGRNLWTAHAAEEGADTKMNDDQDSMEDATENQKKHWVLADPDGFEDGLCEELVSLVVDRDKSGKTKVLSIEKSGGQTLGVEDVSELVTLAGARWTDVVDMLRKG